MKILNQSSGTLSKKELYMLTQSPSTVKLVDVVGTVINVKSWAVFESENKKDGKINTVLAIYDGETVYNSISPTFSETFFDIISLFEDLPLDITVLEGTSKAGRKFVQAMYAGE